MSRGSIVIDAMIHNFCFYVFYQRAVFLLFSCARTDNNTRITLRNKSQCRSHKLLGTLKKSSFVSSFSFERFISVTSLIIRLTKEILSLVRDTESILSFVYTVYYFYQFFDQSPPSFWRAKGSLQEDRARKNIEI